MKKALSALALSTMLVGSLTACGAKNEEKTAATPAATATATVEATATPAATETVEYKDGKFDGTGKGLKGDITVEVVVAKGKIDSVKVTKQDETPEIYKNADPAIPNAIVEKQTADVDTVANATMSSKGIIEAVKDALAKAAK